MEELIASEGSAVRLTIGVHFFSAMPNGHYFVFGSMIMLALTYLVTRPIVKYFEKEMGSTSLIEHFKRSQLWLVLFQVTASLFFVGEKISGMFGRYLLDEFLGAMGIMLVWYGILTIPPYFLFVIVSLVIFYGMESHEKGTGVAKLRNFDAMSPHVSPSQALLQGLCRRLQIPHPLAVPPVNWKWISVVFLVVLTSAFGCLWMRAVWVAENLSIATAIVAGGWAAESAIDKGEAPKLMVLRERQGFDDAFVDESVKVQYWENAFGFTDYIMQKGFVEGYNIYIKNSPRAR